ILVNNISNYKKHLNIGCPNVFCGFLLVLYYFKVLEIGPHQDYLYFKTAQFYLDYIENKEKAINIVKKGIEINPDSQQLKDFLKTLK
ncbi:hypothetical protein KJ603_01255, partial [Patescibacteria group bacterium]|nr:hypothetical protein [Patescibacteria group bacterium]